MDQQPCPHCGYCPACGRAPRPFTIKVVPGTPYIQPMQPWYQQPYTGDVRYGRQHLIGSGNNG